MSTDCRTGKVVEFGVRPVRKVEAVRPELVLGSEAVLQQGLDLLSQVGDATYGEVVEAPYKASIGQHYRHVLEHFQCLTRGAVTGEINYDARERNARLENEAEFAKEATREVLHAIAGYDEGVLARKCRVIHSVTYGAGEPTSIETNLGRELAYCTGHAIHHYAILRLICAKLGVGVGEEFGFAPSTLKHMSALSAD